MAQVQVYSTWPTYPQLYVDGELLGGADIVAEMVANGELADALNVSPSAAPVAPGVVQSLIQWASHGSVTRGNSICMWGHGLEALDSILIAGSRVSGLDRCGYVLRDDFRNRKYETGSRRDGYCLLMPHMGDRDERTS